MNNSGTTVTKISYEGLKTSSDNIKRKQAELAKILEAVETNMKKVNTEEVWKSDAAANMLQKFMQLKEKCYVTFDTAIGSYATFLANTAQNYAAADAAIKAKQDELLQ